jgi:hypothetical protein
MKHDYKAAYEWFEFVQTANREEFIRYGVKHPDQIKRKDAIFHALKLAKKVTGEPSPEMISEVVYTEIEEQQKFKSFQLTYTDIFKAMVAQAQKEIKDAKG